MRPALRFASRHAVEFPRQADVLHAGQTGHQRIGFGHEADQTPESPVPVRIAVAAEFLIEHAPGPRRGRNESHQEL